MYFLVRFTRFFMKLLNSKSSYTKIITVVKARGTVNDSLTRISTSYCNFE